MGPPSAVCAASSSTGPWSSSSCLLPSPCSTPESGGSSVRRAAPQAELPPPGGERRPRRRHRPGCPDRRPPRGAVRLPARCFARAAGAGCGATGRSAGLTGPALGKRTAGGRSSRRVGNEVLGPAAQNCDQRNWFVTSWWYCTSEALMRVPRALGQRSAWASLISAYLPCASSPNTSCMNRLPLNCRMAS